MEVWKKIIIKTVKGKIPNRACTLPSTMEGIKSSEIYNWVTNTFLAKGYPPAVISNVLKKTFPEIYSFTNERVFQFDGK